MFKHLHSLFFSFLFLRLEVWSPFIYYRDNFLIVSSDASILIDLNRTCFDLHNFNLVVIHMHLIFHLMNHIVVRCLKKYVFEKCT